MPKKRDPNLPRLVPVAHVSRAAEILWELLKERPAEANISHGEMPTWEEHCSFVDRFPYRVWYLVKHREDFVGAIYLTRNFEVGVAIFNAHQGKGYGTFAVAEVVDKWGRKTFNRPSLARKAIIARIAPGNAKSKKFFAGLGFKHVEDVHALDL